MYSIVTLFIISCTLEEDIVTEYCLWGFLCTLFVVRFHFYHLPRICQRQLDRVGHCFLINALPVANLMPKSFVSL